MTIDYMPIEELRTLFVETMFQFSDHLLEIERACFDVDPQEFFFTCDVKHEHLDEFLDVTGPFRCPELWLYMTELWLANIHSIATDPDSARIDCEQLTDVLGDDEKVDALIAAYQAAYEPAQILRFGFQRLLEEG